VGSGVYGYACGATAWPPGTVKLGFATVCPRLPQRSPLAGAAPTNAARHGPAPVWPCTGLDLPRYPAPAAGLMRQLEQEVIDLRLQLEERDGELSAARAANRPATDLPETRKRPACPNCTQGERAIGASCGTAVPTSLGYATEGELTPRKLTSSASALTSMTRTACEPPLLTQFAGMAGIGMR
jgi:hypothetical protein